MSGRSGYGRSRIVGKIIHKPANMMMAGLAPKVGKPGWAIRLYYQRVDECFCICDKCTVNKIIIILPPNPLPPNPPALPPPGQPPLQPPGGIGPLPPGAPIRPIGQPSANAQLPNDNGFPWPSTADQTGNAKLQPFGTRGCYTSKSWGTANPIITGTPDDPINIICGSHWVAARFNREITVLGGEALNVNPAVGDYPVSTDISWNNLGPYMHGESANTSPATPSSFINVKYFRIAEASQAYQVGFGINTAGAAGATNPGVYVADNVYIAQNLPFSWENSSPVVDPSLGDNPTVPYGVLPGQWLLLDIRRALVSMGGWDGVQTDYSGSPNVGQGQWPPTPAGRKAAFSCSRYNGTPLIHYDPRLSTPGPNVWDQKNGLLFAEACEIGVGVLGPLAPFKTLVGQNELIG